MKIQLAIKTNQALESGYECHPAEQDALSDALSRSIRELHLLGKFYQKHGHLRQAQEIYYYILSIQERRDQGKRSAN
jgi:hypothetical protein